MPTPESSAYAAWRRLQALGPRVVTLLGGERPGAGLVVGSLYSRASELHRGLATLIKSGNHASTWTVLRAQMENAAAVRYFADHPGVLTEGIRAGRDIKIGRIMASALRADPDWKAIYSTLSSMTHPGMLALISVIDSMPEGLEGYAIRIPAGFKPNEVTVAWSWCEEFTDATTTSLGDLMDATAAIPRDSGPVGNIGEPEVGSEAGSTRTPKTPSRAAGER